MTENTAIGLRIRNLRESKKYSREVLAEKANISSQFLADIEYGKKGMTVETLIKLCNALTVSPDDLIFGFNDNEQEINEINSMLNFADKKTLSAIKKIIEAVIQLND